MNAFVAIGRVKSPAETSCAVTSSPATGLMPLIVPLL